MVLWQKMWCWPRHRHLRLLLQNGFPGTHKSSFCEYCCFFTGFGHRPQYQSYCHHTVGLLWEYSTDRRNIVLQGSKILPIHTRFNILLCSICFCFAANSDPIAAPTEFRARVNCSEACIPLLLSQNKTIYTRRLQTKVIHLTYSVHSIVQLDVSPARRVVLFRQCKLM